MVKPLGIVAMLVLALLYSGIASAQTLIGILTISLIPFSLYGCVELFKMVRELKDIMAKKIKNLWTEFDTMMKASRIENVAAAVLK